MKKLIKSSLMMIILTITICMGISLDVNAKTGHEEYTKITFMYNPEAKLLIDMTKLEKQQLLNNVKKKAFGWSNKTNHLNLYVMYEANTIFSRANNTQHAIEFEYSTTSKQLKQVTKELGGTLGLKLSGKTTKISWSLDKTIRAEIGTKTENVYQEETDFTIRIEPKKKVSLIVKGMATLSNGCSKYYVFGICTSKKFWEYVDVVNEFYELYEETLTY